MINNSKLFIYNIALLVTVFVFRSSLIYLPSIISNKTFLIVAELAISLFTFNLVFCFLEILDRKLLWRYIGRVTNLSGKWKATLCKGEDEWYSDVEILQTRDKIELVGRNYSDKLDDYHSTWTSEFAVIEKNQLFYRYQIGSIKGEYQKKGTSIIALTNDNDPDVLWGTFGDTYPDTSVGRIIYRRVKSSS